MSHGLAWSLGSGAWGLEPGVFAILRKISRRRDYTLLALFRSVSLRGEQKGEIRWADLLRWVWSALIAASDAHLEAIRLRKSIAVWS